MKLEVFNLNNIVFYLSKEYLNKIHFKIDVDVEKEFKKLFIRLKNIYNLNLNGYYEVIVYINDLYGIIIEMEKDDDEYIKIFGDTLDMKITFKFDCEILYKIENIDFIDFSKYNLYYKNNNLYISIKDKYLLEKNEYLNLLENSKLVYGSDLKKLKLNLKKIR
ncbi:MAG: hypothetical protein IJO32_05805 [Bacilli bacterium]|nr:hypothetical protein [Bacilli bacterium]